MSKKNATTSTNNTGLAKRLKGPIILYSGMTTMSPEYVRHQVNEMPLPGIELGSANSFKSKRGSSVSQQANSLILRLLPSFHLFFRNNSQALDAGVVL